MIKGYTLILVLTVWCFKAYPQNINLSGKVIEKQSNIAVQNANITFYADARILYKTTTDTAGIFNVFLAILEQTDRIKISSVNYDEFTVEKKSINYNLNNKGAGLGVFKIKLRKIELQEVKVKSKRRYRDTTKIDLSKEKFERSIMIDDIFSKEFGFTKDANGQLYYKGKPIAGIEVNGGDFFGKNNMDIYHLLPALILDKINVIETNIDSTTNTTTLKPTLKVNLILKDKYKKGKFGNANLGIGSADRYIGNSSLYTYKNKEQISLTANANNINNGDGFILDPKVDFSANGNNSISKSAKLTYRNVYADKIEVDLSVKGRVTDRDFTSESETQQENINIFSKTFTASHSRSLNINDTRFNIKYKIDSLNNINASQSFEHNHVKESDSLNYIIKTDSLNTNSQLNKLRNTNSNIYNTQIDYQRNFRSKKGRSLNIDMQLKNDIYDVNEFDNVNNISNQSLNKYFINGNRSASENKYILNSNFTEPLGDDGYVVFDLSYKKEKLNYNTHTASDTILNNTDYPTLFNSNFFEAGIKFQKTLEKISFDGNINGIRDSRNTEQLQHNNTRNFFNLNFDLRADYKIDKNKNFSLSYSGITNYPGIQQLTSLDNSFDLIFQTNGNINLKPEEKQSIKATYIAKPSDEETINLSGEFDHYNNKFGYEINNSVNVVENTFVDNLGSANNGQISFSLFKTFFDNQYFNFSNSLSYQESPSIINNKLTLNNGIVFNQSLSTSIMIIKSLLTANPLVATSFSKYFYETNSINVTTLTYSDKISLTLKLFQLELYPLINYNHSINNVTSFSMNGRIKKTFFKDYGSIWIQAYDIFNSFKYINNYIGPASYQSVKYSNLNRYILLGISFKFNNMK